MPWGFGKQDQGEGPRLAQEPPELSNLRATETPKAKADKSRGRSNTHSIREGSLI